LLDDEFELKTNKLCEMYSLPKKRKYAKIKNRYSVFEIQKKNEKSNIEYRISINE